MNPSRLCSIFYLSSCLIFLNACEEKSTHSDSHGNEETQPSTHQDHDEEGYDDEISADHHEDGDPHEEGVVMLTPGALISSGIQVAPVQRGKLDQSIVIPAEVGLNPDYVAHINPLVEGQLLEIKVKLGDRVVQDQELAGIRSVVLGQARAELSRTRAIYNVSKRTLDRQETLRDEGINSERRLLEAQLSKEEALAELNAARSRLRVFGSKESSGPDMTLQSPIKGLVMTRHATRGESVTPNDTLFVIGDLSTVWVMGRAYAKHINTLRVGMRANVTIDAYPGQSWTGKVDYISSELDESTRTLPIRVEIANEDERLKPGMFGSLRVDLEKDDVDAVSIMVPHTAILELEGRTVVFVPGDHDTEFKAVPVTVGRSKAGQVEVLKGLEADSRVVIQGGFVLKSELMRAELGEGHAH